MVNRGKAAMIPLKWSLTIMFFTLFVYLFGPIRWISEWNVHEVITMCLLLSYFVSFAMGYLLRCRNIKKEDSLDHIHPDDSLYEKWAKLLRITIYLNLILTVANAFLYVGVKSLPDLLSQMLRGITSPSTVYYGKDASSRSGSIIVWISLFYSPLMYITQFLSIYLFNKLKVHQRVIVVITFVVEIARWLSVGTNKGLFDIVILFLANYLVRKVRYSSSFGERTKNNRRRIRRMTAIVLIAIVAFFTFFGTAISSRVGGVYSEENYQSFPYNLIPVGLRFFIDKFDSYLVQGYDNLEKIIENCSFKWTFGAGNSRFLFGIADRVLGTNITERTYPYQLQQFGVNPLNSWHSAYSWFASDLTFVGVVLLMFIAGYFFASLTARIVEKNDPISMTLFYLMLLMIVNASCTNYVLAYSNGFIGFWMLFFAYRLKSKNIIFTIKNI